jgi:hypothetical protein
MASTFLTLSRHALSSSALRPENAMTDTLPLSALEQRDEFIPATSVRRR